MIFGRKEIGALGHLTFIFRLIMMLGNEYTYLILLFFLVSILYVQFWSTSIICNLFAKY